MWNRTILINKNRETSHSSTLTDESKSWPLLSPPSSVTSGISFNSLPAQAPVLSNEERKKLNAEVYAAWKKNKTKQEAERRETARLEQERKEMDRKEKEEKQKQFEAENRERWLHKKKQLEKAGRQKVNEERNKKILEQEEKRQFSKEMVATWMTVARNRSKPVKGGVFENPRIKYVNPIPWIGVLDD